MPDLSNTAIAVQQLHYAYIPGLQILRGLTLTVPSGAIYGFLGENGAGKSTTIRSVMGLLRPGKGGVRIFGQNPVTSKRSAMKNVGALIESPALYDHLTGYENLHIAVTYRRLPKVRIGEVVELVGLKKHIRKRVSAYSTGMKQRLGLALALLSDPPLLILDEPTNGLDPSGIIEVRNCLRRLNEQGKTIFLSSHLLSEIERIATMVGIIHEGRTMFEGSIAELQRLKDRESGVEVVVDQPTVVAALLSGRRTVVDEGGRLFVKIAHEETPALIEELIQRGIKVYEVRHRKSDLEQLFLHLTGSGQEMP